MIPKLTTSTPQPHYPKVLLNAVEGWGKTTFVAYAEKPAIVIAPRETGYETLLSAGRAPAILSVKINTWPDLIEFIDDQIKTDKLAYKTLGFDALGGFERMCHEHECNTAYQKDWKKFMAYSHGYDTSLINWILFMDKLSLLNDKGVNIVLLSHCRRRNVKNPDGPDYDKWAADLHERTWEVTGRFMDAVLLGRFASNIETDASGQRGKGKGGKARILFTTSAESRDAKNRYGMQECIGIPDKYELVYPVIWKELTKCMISCPETTSAVTQPPK